MKSMICVIDKPLGFNSRPVKLGQESMNPFAFSVPHECGWKARGISGEGSPSRTHSACRLAIVALKCLADTLSHGRTMVIVQKGQP